MRERFFNTAGPVDAQRHYCLPPLERLDLARMLDLIADAKYFVLHAPRQTGKTTCLRALAAKLNETGEYRAVYANIESAQAEGENVEDVNRSVAESIAGAAARDLQDGYPLARYKELIALGARNLVARLLGDWSQRGAPIVLCLDEADSLVGNGLLSILRQLRAGYPDRPAAFPQSVILCGLRDLDEYRIEWPGGQHRLTSGSPFNIKAESFRLGDFTLGEIRSLYSQHTEETGQAFAPGVVESVWELTRGQPWLVNAIGFSVTRELPEGLDRSRTVTMDMVPSGQGEPDRPPDDAHRSPRQPAERRPCPPRDSAGDPR